MSSLDVLDVSLLLDKLIQSMFSHYVLLSTSLKVTFDKLKLLILVKTNFLIFSFIVNGLLKILKKIFPFPKVLNICSFVIFQKLYL